MTTTTQTMPEEDFNLLLEMRKELNDNSITSFSPSYLERFSELFAKSLVGKGDI